MITLTQKVYQHLVSHSQECFPLEACGLLAGIRDQAGHFFPMRNMDASPISYFMDPAEVLGALKRMRALKLDWLGIMHSHTEQGPEPSDKDLRLAGYPQLRYLILSIAKHKQPELKCYHFNDGKAFEETLEII